MTIGLTIILIAVPLLCLLRRRREPSDDELMDMKRAQWGANRDQG